MATRKRPTAKKAVRKPVARKSGTKKVAARKPAEKRPVSRSPGIPGAITRASGEALRLAGIGTDAVARATGRGWDQWLALLDKAGAAAMPHKAIVAMLADRFGMPSWWRQMVTVGYEQARGLREVNQNAEGFSANASRTVQAELERLYGAWADPKLRALWLGEMPVTVRRSTNGKSMRITWSGGESRVEVNFHAAGAGKSRVQISHGKLGDAVEVRDKKAFWAEALGRLKAMLEKAA